MIFRFLIENFVNVLNCKLSSALKGKDKNSKRIMTHLQISINIHSSICNFTIAHTYLNNTYWLHLALTWSSSCNMKCFIENIYSKI